MLRKKNNKVNNFLETSSEYNMLMNSLDVSVSKHKLDEHFTVVWANDNYYKTFGYTKKEYEELFHNQCDVYYRNNPEDWQALTEYVTNAIASGQKQYTYLCRMMHKNGRKLWIRLTGTFTEEEYDGYKISYSVMTDISEQMQLSIEQTVTYNNFPGMIAKFKTRDEGFELIDANNKYYTLFTHKKFYRVSDMNEENGMENVKNLFQVTKTGAAVCFNISPSDNNGNKVYLHITAECVDWENGRPIYLLLYSDVTQLTMQNELLAAKNRELEYYAFTDPVTDGMNRTSFEMKTSEIIKAAPPKTYAMVWLNLLKFKLVNDIAGNKKGDELLKYIYSVISENLYEDEMAARLSSDNYTILIRNDSDDVIISRFKNIVRKINAFNAGRQYKYILSFTAGVYRINDPLMEVTLMQDRAHVTNKEIKKHEGNFTCRFYSDIERLKLISEQSIENRMKEALENREFTVYMQPKRSLKNDEVVGAEALVRWVDPEKGVIPPAEFIPLFEKNGFVAKLDLFVFDEVCRIIKKWMDKGLTPVPVSVNLSRIHFSDPDFVNTYVKIREKYGVPSKYLELEVTENIIFEDIAAFADIVAKIHKAGFTCSMDDFGSGYSSLNALKDLNVDTLKLDRAFFGSEHMDNIRERKIITAVIELAKKLKMSTVAEGVETDSQQDFLKHTDCDMVQGFVFSKPLPEETFETLVYGNALDEK